MTTARGLAAGGISGLSGKGENLQRKPQRARKLRLQYNGFPGYRVSDKKRSTLPNSCSSVGERITTTSICSSLEWGGEGGGWGEGL